MNKLLKQSLAIIFVLCMVLTYLSIPLSLASDGSWSVKEKTITASDGKEYVITLTYDKEAGFPEGAELVVAEIPEGTPEYDQYINASFEKLGREAGDSAYAKAFDISVIDPATGEKIQPGSNVKVTIDLKNRSLTEDSDVSIVHFAEPSVESAAESTVAEPVEATTVESAPAAEPVVEPVAEPADVVPAAEPVEATAVEAPPAEVPSAEPVEATAAEPPQISADQAEVLDTAVVEGNLTFETSGFSVYVVIDHEGNTIVQNPRVEFHFLNYKFIDNGDLTYTAGTYDFVNVGGTEQSSQIILNGESMEMIMNPPNIKVGGLDKYFFGWYQVDPKEVNVDSSVTPAALSVKYEWPAEPQQVFFEKPLSITSNGAFTVGGEITWSIDEASGKAVLDSEGTAHVYLAPIYEDYYFINYRFGAKETSLWGTIMRRQLIVLGNDEQVTVHIGNTTAPTTDATRQVFAGWETVTTKQEQKVDTESHLPVWIDVNNNEVAAATCPDGYSAYMIDVPDETKVLFKTVDPVTAVEQTATVYTSNGAVYTPAESSGYNIVITKNDLSGNSLDLYPVFAQARWIKFNNGKSGNGATYVPAQFLLTSDLTQNGSSYASEYYVTKLPAGELPKRNGYEFKGWYANASIDPATGDITNLSEPKSIVITRLDGTTYTAITTATKITDENGTILNSSIQKFDDGGNLLYEIHNGRIYLYDSLRELTLYALWQEVDDTTITVLVWKQKVSDNVYALDSQKTYDYSSDDSDLSVDARSGRTLAQLRSAGTLTPYEGKNITGFHCNTSKTTMNSAKVVGDGSTVVNIYYDRDINTLHFQVNSGPTFTWTETTGNTEPQYGLVDGAYTQLTRVDDGTNHSYTYTPAYVPSVEKLANMYGFVNGAYVPLTSTPQYENVETQVPVYTLTNTLTAGNDYLIVNSNIAGTGRYALGHNNNTISRDEVRVYSGTTETGNSVYIRFDDLDATSVWTVSDGFTFKNGNYYLHRGNQTTLNADSTSTNWTWNTQNNRLYTSGWYSTYYLRYNNNSFNLNNNQNSVYLYVAGNTITETTNTLTGYTYTYNGQPYTGTRYVENNTALAYNGTRYTDISGETSTTENGSGQYGKDSNGTVYPLNYSTTPVYKWTYKDANNNTVTYTGPRYTQTQGGNSNSWHDIYTITALYGQDISSNFPIVGWNGTTYNNGERWDPQTNSLGWSQVMVIVNNMPEDSVTFRLDTATRPLKTMNYYVEVLPGQTGETTHNGISFIKYCEPINARYNGVTQEDYLEIIGFSRYRWQSGTSGGTYTTGMNSSGFYIYNTSQDQTINFYYLRDIETLTYMVNYPNVAGLTYDESGGESSDHTETLPYQASLVGYDGEFTPNAPDHYFFRGWYEDAACTEKFNFNSTMPAGDKIIYAKWQAERFPVKIDPNGAEIDHINHNYSNPAQGYNDYWFDSTGSHAVLKTEEGGVVTWKEYHPDTRSYTDITDPSKFGVTPFATFNRTGDSGYETGESTLFNANYNATVAEYPMEGRRGYVEISDVEADNLGADNYYYYLNSQYNSAYDGDGLPSDLRNALYLKESELYQYWQFYHDWITGNLQGQYVSGVTALPFEVWKDTYLTKNANGEPQKYRELHGTESYAFLGWYKLDENGDPEAMPYNFSDVVTGPLTLRAYWRLDGGYRIIYTPIYNIDDVEINGEMDAWMDPQVSTATYADGAKTNIYRQPTGLTANGSSEEGQNYIFRGWQLVSVKIVNGNPVYTPLESGKFYDPGDPFTIKAGFADDNGLIHMQAVYERKAEAYKRPQVADLVLDANTGYLTDGAGNELTSSMSLNWSGSDTAGFDSDAEQIIFGHHDGDGLSDHFQTGKAVHLYRYATQLEQDAEGNPLTDSKNYFKHPEGHLLLGFDDAPNEDDYVATYPADSIISVQRSDNKTVYAVWEPMVYINIVNATKNDSYGSPGGPLTLNFSSTDDGSLQIVNEKTGLYDRVPVDSLTGVTIEEGETLRLVMPYGEGKNITITGTNDLGTGIILRWEGELKGNKTGHPSGEANNGENFSMADTMVKDETGITITFTSIKADYTLILDDNWEDGHETEVYYSSKIEDSNYVGNSYTLPTTSTRLGYEFVGWAETKADADAGIAQYTVSPSALTVGNMKTGIFDRLDAADGNEDQVVTLYAAWKPKGEASTVYIYKSVPAPGDTDKEFTFTLNASATFLREDQGDSSSGTTRTYSGTYTLKNDQYLKIVTTFNAGDKGKNATVSAIVEKYNVGTGGAADSFVLTYPALSMSFTNSSDGTGRLKSFSSSVTESDYSSDYYTTDFTYASVTAAKLTKDNNRKLSWNSTFAGGTAIFTNTRQTVDVTVKKELVSPGSNRNFTFGAKYTFDGKSVTRDDFTVMSGTDAGYVIKSVPVGAALTVTEKGADLLNYTTSATLSGSALGVTASTTGSGTATDPSIQLKSVTATITRASVVNFKNVLKSVKVKIVKVGVDGSNTYNDVEAQFNMRSELSTVFSGRVTVPVDATAPNGNIVFESDHNYNGGARDPELYVGNYTLEETKVYGSYIKLADNIGMEVYGTADGAEAKIVGTDAASIEKVGDVWTVTVKNRKTLNIEVRAALLDPMIHQRNFTYTGSYMLNGVKYGLDGHVYNDSDPYSFDLIAYATSNGDYVEAAGANKKTLTIPVSATELQIHEDTSKVTTAPETIATTYTTYNERKANGSATGDGRTKSDTYAYTAAMAAANDKDVITFYNNKNTIDVTLKKIVGIEDKTGTFSFTATLLNVNNPIVGYPIFINATPADTSDDAFTDSVDGTYQLGLTDGGEYVLTVPVGARLKIQETGVNGNASGDSLDAYETTVNTVYTSGGAVYGGNAPYDKDTRLYTLTAAPSSPLTVTFNNGSTGVDVMFKKIDGFGEALGNAEFRFYQNPGFTSPQAVSVNKKNVFVVSSAAIFTNAALTYNVEFAIAPGVYYMVEANQVDGYEKNDNVYRLIVGDAAATAAGVTFPAGQSYRIDLYEGGQAKAIPDIATYGVLNISTATRKVIIRKSDIGYNPISRVPFGIFRYDLTTVNANLESLDSSGVIQIDKLPYGIYYLHETDVPNGYSKLPTGDNWFRLTVKGDSVTLSEALDSAPAGAAAIQP